MTLERGAALRRLTQMPSLAKSLYELFKSTDVVLLRSPSHSALIGRFLTTILKKPTVTKWAGLFGEFEGERLTSRFERFCIRRGRDIALVYGPASERHLIPFVPALLSSVELENAAMLGSRRTWEEPWRILSVGRLLPVKGFDLALAGLAELHSKRPDLSWEFTLVGDGPEKESLMEFAKSTGIAPRVRFAGAMPFEDVQKQYAKAHVVIMPGVKEGWPKIIAEAWAHGAVPVAAAAGIVPWILSDVDSGVLFDPNAGSLARSLEFVLTNPDRVRELSLRGYARCRELSLEAFAQRLESLLTSRLGLR
jgi:glycosyltransferase involved in cell wall biosynthesis